MTIDPNRAQIAVRVICDRRVCLGCEWGETCVPLPGAEDVREIAMSMRRFAEIAEAGPAPRPWAAEGWT